MRAVFMGSPEFAVPCLRALAQRAEVVAVVSQPDKPAGRGLGVVSPAVKLAAQELGLPVLQPASIRPDRSDFPVVLAALQPDLVVVVAYGKILPPVVLAVPKQGCWNIHGSILPRYRGAAPIQWALIRGEQTTGVTLMEMDAGMDTGPMLLTRQIPISDEDTAGSLHQRLGLLGAELLDEGLQRLSAGTLPPARPQDSALATLAPLLDKEHGRVDFCRDAALVSAQIRGVDPWPGAFTTLRSDGGGRAAAAGAEVPLKVFHPQAGTGAGLPGQVLGVDREGLLVACGRGALRIAELQLPGRRRMAAAALLAGHPLPLGTILGLDPTSERSAPNPRLS